MRVIILTMFISIIGFGQGIWKDFREMGAIERQEYANVLNTLGTNGINVSFNTSHANFAQHGNDNFLPWHRIMLYHFEREAKAVCKYFNQGYLDWYTTPLASSSSILLQNSSGGVSQGLLGQNLNWAFSRGTNNQNFINYNINNNLVQTNYNLFRNSIEESPHNPVHGILSGGFGEMRFLSLAPLDPVFYFHHAMVDKVWEQWSRASWNGTDFGSVTNGNIPSLNSTSVFNPRAIFDPRSVKIWYAESGKVILDKYTASHQTLGVTTGPEFYFYTGLVTIAGSVANYFTVPAGIEAKIESMSEIAILPGFSAPNGSYFGAKSLNNFPAGCSNSGGRVETNTNQIAPKLEEKPFKMNIMPNPSDGTFSIVLPDGELIFNMWITSALGNITNYSRTSDFEVNLINAPYGVYNVLIQSQTGKKYMGRVVVR